MVGEALGKLLGVGCVFQRVPDPRAGIVVVVVIELREVGDVVVGGTTETTVEVGEDETPLAARLRFPQDDIVAPAAVARPDFCRPIVCKSLHVHLSRHGIEISLHTQVLAEQAVHDPIR